LENGEYGILLFEAIEILDDKSFIPYLEKNLKSSKNDRSIREEWISDLKFCLKNLKE
jgi:hypothetical protein